LNPVSRMGRKSGSGPGMKNPNWVKILILFDAGSGKE
jgi:hypothetical protein